MAWHLGQALHKAGVEVIQVYSRTLSASQALAEELDSHGVAQLNQIVPSAHLYLLAVNDQAIAPVVAQLRNILSENALLCHTSGATPSTIFGESHYQRYGVFYPLQTLSKARPIDFGTVPLCIDANLSADQSSLLALAKKLSSQVYHITDQDRAILHIAAVFANNFSNHLFAVAKTILAQHDLPFDLLKALIQETAAKVQEAPPSAMQTGPAIRKDESTIQRHLDLLADFPEFQQLYQQLSSSIQNNNS